MSPISSKKGSNNSLQVSGSFLFSSNYSRPRTQYRATHMWHKSLETFLSSVPLTQHRSKTRFWRVYDSTFTGGEAVTWFHDQLKQSFDQEISREQTRKLLGKFYRVGVFCNVEQQSELDGGEVNENDFKDSHMHIYRLSMDRPGVPATTRTPSPSGNMKKITSGGKIKKNYSVEIKPLSVEDKENIYFDFFVEKLNPLTSLSLSEDLLPRTSNIYTNLTSTPHSPPLFPSWLFPAMRYLTHYPYENKVHVSYANFEHDVLLLVADYFYSVHDRIGQFIPNVALFVDTLANIEPQVILSKYQEKFPFPKSEMEEIDQIFTPRGKNSSRFVMGKNRRRIFDDSVSAEDVNVKPMGIVDTSRYREASVYYATNFDVGTPVTRVLSTQEMYAYDNPNLNLSPVDLINHPKYGSIRKNLFKGRKSLSEGNLLVDSVASGGGDIDDNGGFVEGTNPLPETKRPTIEALTLLLLTLDHNKRKHLEALLKFIGKVEKNYRLMLDVATTNKDLMFEFFGRVAMDSPSEPGQLGLFTFMVANVDILFNGEYLENLKKTVDDVVSERQIKKIPIPTGSSSRSLSSKENYGGMEVSSFCSKISMIEYENQRLLGETAKSLRNLLDEIVSLKDEKLRKKQLKKFQKEYPHIYAEKYYNSSFVLGDDSDRAESSFQQQKSKKRTPFGVLI